MFRLRDNGLAWIGTNAERLLNFSLPYEEGLNFYEKDTGNYYKVIQQSWVQINSGTGSGIYLEVANNLSDVADAVTSLSNIGGEPDLGLPAVDGYVLSSTTLGVRSWVAQTGGGGGGATQFTATIFSDVSWDNEVIPIWQASKDN